MVQTQSGFSLALRVRVRYIVNMLTFHEIEIRVRYQETDGQGRVHHANYLTWFELGRVELLRAMGHSYRELEEAGVLLVVAEMNVQYFQPAFFDDVLSLRTTAIKAKGARIEHEYKVHRGSDLLAQATSTIACIDRTGKVSRLPKWLAGTEPHPAPRPEAPRGRAG